MATEADLAKLGNAPVISDSVGRAGRNRPTDVGIVQFLLNNALYDDTAVPFLPIDGQADQELDKVITHFQKTVLKQAKPDGKFDRSGKAILALRKLTIGSFLPAIYGAELDFSLWQKMHTETLLRLVEKQFGVLSQQGKDGFRYVFGRMVADPALYDIRWGAYMLATIKRETSRYVPIEESKSLWSKKTGAGEYAEEVNPTDPTGLAYKTADGKAMKARYYGRGYVQLTWLKNYRRMGEALGLGDGLVAAPERALEPAVAYDVASLGMRDGMFAADKAGKPMSLSRFINASKCNYRLARQIINGLDHADEIAADAVAFEVMMLLATSGPPKGG